MTEKLLVYLPDPYGVGNAKYALADTNGIELVAGEDLALVADVVVTYDVAILIDDLRRSNASLPRMLIDIGEAVRLAVGISKADGGEQKWGLWKRARRHFNTAADWRLAQSLHEGRELHPSGPALLSTLGMMANAFIALWAETKTLLFTNGERERFFFCRSSGGTGFLQPPVQRRPN